MPVETVESLCQKARQAIELRDWEKARQVYRQALGLRADAPDVHYGLATVCFQMKDLTGAVHHFKEVTRLDPLRAGAYINLGAVYNLLDQLDDAVNVLRRGIQLDPHRAEGYYNLGLVYKRKNNSDLAIHAYREALRVNPRMADAHFNLANLHMEKQLFGQAVAHYRQALELRPNWEKAVAGLDQAEAASEQAQALSETPPPAPAAATASVAPAEPLKPRIDPDRTVDPNLHGTILSNLHKATIESENHSRRFLQVIETEIEPALKELSAVLLYANSPSGDLDSCVQKFEAAVHNMRSAQRNLQSCIVKVRSIGDKLIKS